MSEKIKVRDKRTGATRYVTRAAYALLTKTYELISETGEVEQKAPESNLKSKKKDVEPAGDDVESVRKQYQAFFGEAPDKRKGVQTLLDEIEEFKSGNNTEK